MDAGQQIGGRFRIDDLERDLLGRGGMGAVYRATDALTGEIVAVKALDPCVVARDPDLVERFTREGEALRRLNHPNIVRMVAAVRDQGRHYLVMEYVDGGSLREMLEREGRLPPQRALEIALEVADALARAHHLSILHRDLKPENVLLAGDGTPRLADFGLAHLAASPRLTQSGMLMGTVACVSPEACRGEATDERSDIWSFGVMLFEMLAGCLPFPGETFLARLNAILTQPVPDVSQLAAGISDGLADLVYRMLEKDPCQRIPSVRLVGAELEAFLKGRTSARPTPAGSRFATPTPPAGGPRHNLPVQITPFVGRQAELLELARLLEDPAVRLVTVVGLAGMGKTRLALEVGAAQVDRFGQGVCFVPLAPLVSVERLVPAVGGALGLVFRDREDPRQQVLDHLRHKVMLLILDNLEHLLAGREESTVDGWVTPSKRDGVDLVIDILQAAPGVKILATSRLKLNVQDEYLFQLEGMDVPDSDIPRDPLAYSAVKLFVQSARRVRPGFELAGADMQAVARICRLVGGMPLGILLAAAWVKMLTPAEIADEIARGLDLLETDGRDVPERQRSVRAAFDYSWSQLAGGEQAVFRGLSVFRGGFTREAAQQVTGASLRDLMQLVDRSLLQRSPTGRYEVHELVRQYAADKLAASREVATVRERHLEYYVSLAGVSGEEPGNLPPRHWLQQMVAEVDNLRAALSWGLESGTPQAGLRLAVRLRWFWYTSLPPREGRDWLQRLLVANPDSTLLRARALEILGQIVTDLGEFHIAQTLFEESLALSEELGDVPGMANSLFKLSWPAEELGDLARARSLLERSLSISEQLNNPRQAGYILHGLAELTFAEGDLQRALGLFEQVADRQRSLGMITLRLVLRDMGCVLVRLAELDRSREVLKESLSLGLDLEADVSEVLVVCGYLAGAEGQPIRAVQLLAAAEVLRNAAGASLNFVARTEYERNMALLHSQLRPGTFESAWAAGQALTLEEAIVLAMSEEHQTSGVSEV